MSSYDPDGNLLLVLDYHLEAYRADFREYWQLDAESCPSDFEPSEWAFVRLLDQIGGRILLSAQALRANSELAALLRDPQVKAEQDSDDSALWSNVAQARAELELADQAISRLIEGKDRLGTLLLFLSRFELSPRATAYTDRMIQCYLWSMDTECAIMARSVLEAALEELLPEARMVELGFTSSRYGFSFSQHCDAASRLGFLTDDGIMRLQQIRRSGNDSVHNAPGLHPSGFMTVTNTILCLRELFPDSSH